MKAVRHEYLVTEEGFLTVYYSAAGILFSYDDAAALLGVWRPADRMKEIYKHKKIYAIKSEYGEESPVALIGPDAFGMIAAMSPLREKNLILKCVFYDIYADMKERYIRAYGECDDNPGDGKRLLEVTDDGSNPCRTVGLD